MFDIPAPTQHAADHQYKPHQQSDGVFIPPFDEDLDPIIVAEIFRHLSIPSVVPRPSVYVVSRRKPTGGEAPLVRDHLVTSPTDPTRASQRYCACVGQRDTSSLNDNVTPARSHMTEGRLPNSSSDSPDRLNSLYMLRPYDL
jgi:hypothetical protein